MSEVLDRESQVPLYAQLEAILRNKIDSGEWRPSQRIPSENELNRIYGLSRMTARGVITRLVNEGLLVRVQGKGTFVSQNKISAVSPAYMGVREQLEEMGFATTTQLITASLESPSSDVRERLRLPRGSSVYAIVRRRLVDDTPISIHRSYVPAELAPALDERDIVGEQLCVVLDTHYGLTMRKVREDLEAVGVGAEDAKLLDMKKGDPVLLLHDLVSDAADRPFEYSTIVFHGDRLSLHFEHER
ncbi:GntR family transcriptional regulator [Streptomyces gilvus]|uniref:GntR family transcriptional regulator n=1 Tax=Streptomyces gilvus TaxID=2920937 RepID=UPI001F1075AF|nr:GntR family transcriptional regulator [Streptomyces sp. CME 23]MCH5677963.1 GntR family transcriptional regulator [Streptomyces sp. CME 23]